MSDTNLTGVWHVGRKPGFTISHPIMARTPGCPEGPHPTRYCKCKFFRSLKDANAYVAVFGGTVA